MDGHRLSTSGTLVNLPAVLLIACLTGVLMLGVGKAARFNGVVVTIKLSAIALFVVFGLAYAHTRNWVPFLPERTVSTDGVGAYGWAGVFKASGVVFVAFLGFDVMATAAQEARNPQKTMPISILLTLGISITLYVAVSAAMTGLTDFHRLNTAAPLTVALAEAGSALGWLKTYVGVSAAIGLSAGVWAALFGLSRLMFSLAQDGLLPAAFARSTAADLVPRVTVAIAGAAGMLVAGIMPINLLGELISTGTLTAFIAVCAAVIALRLRDPYRVRPFSVPYWRVIPALGILSCLFVFASLGLPAIERVLAWQAVGWVIFVAIARRRRIAAG
jgi:APA family basic amino acid/polyamine antiporter